MPDTLLGTEDAAMSKHSAALASLGVQWERGSTMNPLTFSTAGSHGEVYAWEDKVSHLCTSDRWLRIHLEGYLEEAPWRHRQRSGCTLICQGTKRPRVSQG